MTMSDATISVRLPHKTRKALDKAAKDTRRSRAFLIKEALDRHLTSIGADERRDDVARRLRLIEELAGAGASAGGLRSAEEIDAMIREMRGDD
jgi:predicted DNA-binding protein